MIEPYLGGIKIVVWFSLNVLAVDSSQVELIWFESIWFELSWVESSWVWFELQLDMVKLVLTWEELKLGGLFEYYILFCILWQWASHRVVEHANDMLVPMSLRGGCGYDPVSGDGAGEIWVEVTFR